MTRLAYALAVGLVGAAFVAVAILLLLPGIAAERRWSALAAVVALEQPTRLGANDAAAAPGAPFFLSALCRFDLRDGALRVSAEGRAAFWSAAVIRRDGSVAASLGSGALGDAAPDFRVLSAAQIAGIAGSGPFPLEADMDEGVLVMRVFAPDETWKPLAEAMLASLACRTER